MSACMNAHILSREIVTQLRRNVLAEESFSYTELIPGIVSLTARARPRS